MKRGAKLFKRVSTSNREPRERLIGGTADLKEKKSSSSNQNEVIHSLNLSNNSKKQQVGGKNRKVDKVGSLFYRLVSRRNIIQEKDPLTPRLKQDQDRHLVNSTPVTFGTEQADEIEVPLSIPCQRVPSHAETTQTQEISDFSTSMNDVQEKSNRSFKRASSAKSSSSRLVLDTSAVCFGKARSARLSRKTGNESLGDAKPDQPRLGYLPPLLSDDNESVGESSCSGITMDFTFGEDGNTPVRPPVGRLGEGVRPQISPNSLFPPSYIITDESDDLYRPSFGDF